MVYQARLSHCYPAAVGVSLLGLSTILFGLAVQEFALVAFGAAVCVWLLAIRYRIRVEISDDVIRYTGLFSSQVIKASEVTSVSLAADEGYPWDRLYGPLTYRVTTPARSILINMTFMPSQLLDRLKTVGRQ